MSRPAQCAAQLVSFADTNAKNPTYERLSSTLSREQPPSSPSFLIEDAPRATFAGGEFCKLQAPEGKRVSRLQEQITFEIWQNWGNWIKFLCANIKPVRKHAQRYWGGKWELF